MYKLRVHATLAVHSVEGEICFHLMVSLVCVQTVTVAHRPEPAAHGRRESLLVVPAAAGWSVVETAACPVQRARPSRA